MYEQLIKRAIETGVPIGLKESDRRIFAIAARASLRLEHALRTGEGVNEALRARACASSAFAEVFKCDWPVLEDTNERKQLGCCPSAGGSAGLASQAVRRCQ